MPRPRPRRPCVIDTLRKEGYAAILWHADDIRGTARASGLGELTDDECQTVLDEIVDRHDASFGFSWDDLQVLIEEAVERRGEDQVAE